MISVESGHPGLNLHMYEKNDGSQKLFLILSPTYYITSWYIFIIKAASHDLFVFDKSQQVLTSLIKIFQYLFLSNLKSRLTPRAHTSFCSYLPGLSEQGKMGWGLRSDP